MSGELGEEPRAGTPNHRVKGHSQEAVQGKSYPDKGRGAEGVLGRGNSRCEGQEMKKSVISRN